MTLQLADSFLDALARLEGPDKLQVLDFVDKFRANPAQPGISLERVASGSPGVWSGRVSRDLRAILFQDGETWALLHVDRHDPAYQWAARRSIGRHAVTGGFQIVETTRLEKIVHVPLKVMRDPPMFEAQADGYLLSLGLPELCLPALREVRDEDGLFRLCEVVPEEVADRLLRVADGELVTPPLPVPPERPWTEDPLSRWHYLPSDDETAFRAALAAPMERWIAFLHPSQRRLVEAEFKGPVKVSGSAGTGKTVVAMHRARHQARQGRRVLLTTYVTTLVANLKRGLALFCDAEELGRIRVNTLHSEALALAKRLAPAPIIPLDGGTFNQHLSELARKEAPELAPELVLAEWEGVIQRQGLATWEAYRDARRTGRGMPLAQRQRLAIWNLVEASRDHFASRDQYLWPEICHRAVEALASGDVAQPYDAVIVDEVQDLGAAELGLVRALAAGDPGALMLVGDSGQRIYASPFSLSALGIPVRGRSHVLRVNYRTSQQIHRVAERILAEPPDDMDGGLEARGRVRSLFAGPEPSWAGFADDAAELADAVRQLRAWLDEGLAPGEVAVFARSKKVLDPAAAALKAAGLRHAFLSDKATEPPRLLQLGTMHRAKGLEFKAVLILACSADRLPASYVALKADPQDRAEAMANERRLLYVAASRARDILRITWHGEPSPFLAPLGIGRVEGGLGDG